MKITAISRQQKRADRFSVFVDGKFNFSLNQTQLIKLGIKVGQELSKKDIAKLKNDSTRGKLLDSSLRFLAIRPRSEHEVSEYLRRKKASPDTVKKIINKLRSYAYLDDETFARAWIEDRKPRNISLRQVKQELWQKKVSPEITEHVLEIIGYDDTAIARNLAVKKRRLARYKDKTKLKQYLARKGFSYDTIQKAMDRD